ncbi:DNA-binding transcriptional regulator, AcrR family [Microlunatus sagamiharensis]|uniref:DNA-binding transcriptional regulator, AcrR family n=1 Tax=Microlunatus sagamiharensis TaxID=546874 RepID=A0A1H2LQZ8_9ACTN|nr:TetR-like C-terminal domain-containing protein [Microlunatus sagamiharensis]SDU83001.1 DNA-binding transcriptional regulator, AcrR family [Microlunatus sagamiharensis]
MPRAGLDTAAVTAAAAALADEVGLGGLSMGLLAERLGVRTPSLYKHVANQADLLHRVAVLAAVELGDALRDATQGRAGTDALEAAAQAMRAYVTQHPGRYAAGNAVPPTGPEDPLTVAVDRVLRSFSAVLRGYALPREQETHALRTVRSTLHGFAVLEAEGGFRFATDVDASFAWLVRLLDEGLRASGGTAGREGSS